MSSQPCLMTLGGIGAIYKLNDFVVVKVPRDPVEPDHAAEQRVFDILERYPAHPHLVRSFFRIPARTFLERLPGGDLASLLRTQQTRDTSTQQVLVAKGLSLERSFWWMRELTSAAAWLERIGLVHGDIRPPNILIDAEGHIKLCDFDRAAKIGERLDAGTEPFARLLGDEGGRDRGTYGKAGPRTEQFALGSVLYSMTRGYDPYEDQWFGLDHDCTVMDMLQRREYPALTRSQDTIISECWNGNYVTIQNLENTMLEIASGPYEEAKIESTAWYV
ncbi:kinase-like protein [Trematosphaeria pertusa]|uniref:non-specific serine/threonine protein kinase n=1 Tax=Trematosphaeria pertusa TaxID=390896 RepID=A0A6A6IX02_9PLEO|nr:kinase-like protein [Trematosphaeria pertusa]KAF2254150.1 kinase-like protein [Trematosphaeria pertusa]